MIINISVGGGGGCSYDIGGLIPKNSSVCNQNSLITKIRFCDNNVHTFQSILYHTSWNYVYSAIGMQLAVTRFQGVIFLTIILGCRVS